MEAEEVYSQPSRKRGRDQRAPRRKKFMRHVLRKLPASMSVHSFTRKSTQALAVTNAVGIVNYANMYTLAQLPNYSEFTALFDMYRINKIEITWIYDHNSGDVATSAGVAANANMGVPNIVIVTDYDDASALSVINDYLQYEPCRICRLDKPVRHTLRPHTAVAVYNGAFSGYGNDRARWIDCDSSAAEHYGCKWAVDATMCNIAGSAAVRIGTLNVYYKFFVDFRSTK